MIKEILKKTFIYTIYKNNKQKKINKRKVGKHKFEDRSNGSKIVVFILAGYKNFCNDIVFARIKKFAPPGVDICIISSGLYSESLSNVAKNYRWSYLSSQRNNVSLALNIAIDKFLNAKLIFKLDEDIFVTKNFFKNLIATYEKCQQPNSLIEPTFIAPLIPINGYAHVRILEKLNLLSLYNSMFEPAKMQAGMHRQIECNPEVAKFMWGEGGYMPQIDELDNIFAREKYKISLCPIKFSIGAILFSRKTWEDINFFNLGKGNGLGTDEIQLCSYAMLQSKPIVVCENTCVGHLSFGKQNSEMEVYYKQHKNIFEIKEIE